MLANITHSTGFTYYDPDTGEYYYLDWDGTIWGNTFDWTGWNDPTAWSGVFAWCNTIIDTNLCVHQFI